MMWLGLWHSFKLRFRSPSRADYQHSHFLKVRSSNYNSYIKCNVICQISALKWATASLLQPLSIFLQVRKSRSVLLCSPLDFQSHLVPGMWDLPRTAAFFATTYWKQTSVGELSKNFWNTNLGEGARNVE